MYDGRASAGVPGHPSCPSSSFLHLLYNDECSLAQWSLADYRALSKSDMRASLCGDLVLKLILRSVDQLSPSYVSQQQILRLVVCCLCVFVGDTSSKTCTNQTATNRMEDGGTAKIILPQETRRPDFMCQNPKTGFNTVRLWLPTRTVSPDTP